MLPSWLWILWALLLLPKSLPLTETSSPCEDILPQLWKDHILRNSSLLSTILSEFQGNKCSLDAVNLDGDSALILTVTRGYFDSFKLLLEAGAATNVANGLGFTALHVACARNRTEFALALLPSSVVSLRAANGMTAFLYACRLGNVHLLREFLRMGVRREVKDAEGNSCLHLAVLSGKESAVTLLLHSGFDVNAVDNRHRRTALMLAAGLGNEDVLRGMLDSAPDLALRDVGGRTALDHALSTRNHRIVDELRRALVQRAKRPSEL